MVKLKVGFVKQQSHSPWANFLKGGDMATKMDPRMMAMMAAKARGGARPPMGGRGAMGARPPMAPPGGGGGMPPPGGGGMPPPGGGAPPMMKKGGTTKKMASGGFVRSADGIAQPGKTKAKQIKMKSGGRAC